MIELSRTKKDKRVFQKEIIQDLEGCGIWACNSHGNIENGDYITSSDYLGYGEKQDEIYLCNYTVATATKDSPY